MSHKYQVHQLIRLANPRAMTGRANSAGIFEVTRLLPADQTGEVSYRVRSSASGERAVREHEIAGSAVQHL
jgi:hypothetical protein